MKNIILDKRVSSDILTSLRKLGLEPLLAEGHCGLSEAIASHPDSLFFKLGDTVFTYADFVEAALPLLSDIREYHSNYKLCFVSEAPRPTYPDDCRLNALFIGGKVFAREASLACSVKDHLAASGIPLINVKQGYPACSVLKLSESAAITADKGLFSVLSAEGIDCLTIRPGGIVLHPHEYGFIGGASFVYHGRVCFFGDIGTHPDYLIIKDFIESKGLSILSLSSALPVDLGGALILE